jgi:hypothetical protein
MSSRNYTKHIVANTAPTDLQIGDEYYDPVSNRLYKRVAYNGTTVQNIEITTGGTVVPTSSPSSSNSSTLAFQTRTSNFSASSGGIYLVDTRAGAVTATLPASPTPGTTIQFIDYAGTFNGNNLVILMSNQPYNGTPSSNIAALTVNTVRAAVQFAYVDSTQGWISYAGIITSNVNITLPALLSFLSVGGGGAGGPGYANFSPPNPGGPGGQGGVANGSIYTVAGTVYTINVGRGGAAPGGYNVPGGVGASSNVSYGPTNTLIVQAGGGGGGSSGGFSSPGSTGTPGVSGPAGGPGSPTPGGRISTITGNSVTYGAGSIYGIGGGGGGAGPPAPPGSVGTSGAVIISVPTASFPGFAPGATITTPANTPGQTILTYTTPPATPATYTYTA